MKMKNPPHPGEILRELCIAPLGKPITEIAKKLGVSRVALSELVNERRGVSPEMAIRLSKAFGIAAETWLRMQANYELAKAEKKIAKIKVPRLTTPTEVFV
jgi:addiction module HigA family antidote